MKLAHDIIRYPVNTEKARLGWLEQPEGRGRWYTFEVSMDANKDQIKAAVEQAFKADNVRVTDVRTLVRAGKFRRRRMRGGYTPSVKRAIVTLAPGDKIAFFDGI